MKRFTNSRHRQKGISSFGWIAVFGIFAILLMMFFKVFPMFYGNFQLQSALEGLQQDLDVDPKSKRAIWLSLQKRMYINEVRGITRENVTMERADGKTTVIVTYEDKADYIGNLFIGARFTESIEINR